MTRAKQIALVLFVAFQLLFALVLAEGLLLVFYHHPVAWYPAGLRRFLTWEYFYRRHVVQLDERNARYDPELLYTLRPGHFTFSNVEYSTHYDVNSLGVRDDEQSLRQPEIVAAGDSYAMGWGVEQDETFPQVIERRTGRRVLNTAVASYGTVREMRMVDRVDLSRATTLVIQYCSNDFDENEEFLKNGNHHVPSKEQDWLGAIAYQQKGERYRPFRMVYDAAVWIKRGIEGRKRGGFEPTPVNADRAAELFLNALMHAPQHDLTSLRIVVTDVDPDPSFIRALDRVHRSETYPPYIRAIRVVDVSPRLTPDMYYVIDDHIRPRGHVMVAEALLPEIEP